MKPRYRRIDHGTDSLHFFHIYAVKDRIKLSSVPDSPSPSISIPVSELPIETLLPSESDYQGLLSNFSVLISRVLVSKLKYFSETFHDVVTNHITQKYSK